MMEHENSRLIGELIGEMRGVRSEIAHLNNTLAANTDATHARMSLVEKDVREIKSDKKLAIAHLKGGAFTATIILLIFVKGVYSTITMVLGALSGIKIA